MSISQLRSGKTSLPFSIHAQYLKDFSFENPNPLSSLNKEDSERQPEISVNVQVQAEQVGEALFEVVLHIQTEAKREQNSMFMVEVSYAGLVGITEMSKEELEATLMIDCPVLLFPFVRQLIADSTREGGYPPFMLEPVDFAELYASQKEQPSTLN